MQAHTVELLAQAAIQSTGEQITQWVAAHPEEIHQRRGQWVAITPAGIIASGATQEEVEAQVSADIYAVTRIPEDWTPGGA